MNDIKEPQVYEYYQDGSYDAPYYFGDEEATENTTWCKAYEVMGVYQLMKERIAELEQQLENM